MLTFTELFKIDDEELELLSESSKTDKENLDLDFQPSSSFSERHLLLNQPEVNNLVHKVNLSKQALKLLVSRLQEKTFSRGDVVSHFFGIEKNCF